MDKTVRVGVGVIIFNDSMSVLLIKRAREPKKGEWTLPGGKQEWGETVRETAIREIKEEVDLTIKLHDLVLVDVIDLILVPDHHYTLVDFSCQSFAGQIKKSDEILEYAWVPMDALADYVTEAKVTEVILKAEQAFR